MGILFHSEDVKMPKISKQGIKNWVKECISFEGKKLADVNFIFCSDSYLLEVNKQYLNHDYFTDIITFDYVEGNLISGDIFISIDRVGENAKIYNVQFMNELYRIIIHGILHLIGYKDKDPSEKALMTEKENFYLSKVNNFVSR